MEQTETLVVEYVTNAVDPDIAIADGLLSPAPLSVHAWFNPEIEHARTVFAITNAVDPDRAIPDG